jgi:hypothetical protein
VSHTQAEQQQVAEPMQPPARQRSPARHSRASRTWCKIPDRPPTDFRNFDRIQPLFSPSAPAIGQRQNLCSIVTETTVAAKVYKGARRARRILATSRCDSPALVQK